MFSYDCLQAAKLSLIALALATGGCTATALREPAGQAKPSPAAKVYNHSIR